MNIPPDFLDRSEETGRFAIYSPRTGITYCIEPLDPRSEETCRGWGDVDPASKKIQGNYGGKYKGSIHPNESQISEESGFMNVQVLPPGVSPHSEIERIDRLRYEEGFRPKR